MTCLGNARIIEVGYSEALVEPDDADVPPEVEQMESDIVQVSQLLPVACCLFCLLPVAWFACCCCLLLLPVACCLLPVACCLVCLLPVAWFACCCCLLLPSGLALAPGCGVACGT